MNFDDFEFIRVVLIAWLAVPALGLIAFIAAYLIELWTNDDNDD